MLAALTLCAIHLTACSHHDQAAEPDANCDSARIDKLERQGYADLSQNQWYNAHLAGHALYAMIDSCSQPAIALPAGINGAYLLANAQHAHGDDAQSAFWVQRGLKLLTIARALGMQNPSVSTVYDQMQPRFLSLQSRLPLR